MTARRVTAYRALASASRVTLLDALQQRDGMTITELAEISGLHANTAREHLGRLIEAGFVTCEPEERHTRGRPRMLYRAVAGSDAVTSDVQEQRTKGSSGIPLLKDIPVIGPLFSTGMSDNNERTELVILLTPYVVEDDFDARAVTDAFRNQFAWSRELPRELPKAGMAPAAPAAPAAVETAPGAAVRPVSPRYELPEKDPPLPSVAPTQHFSAPTPASGAIGLPKTSASGVDFAHEKTPSSANESGRGEAAAKAVARPEGKVVTDEKLKQELLDAVRGPARSPNN